MRCPECNRRVPAERDNGYDGDDFCSDQCEENYNERAAERALESYYGGDGPMTAREQQIHDWMEKRRIG